MASDGLRAAATGLRCRAQIRLTLDEALEMALSENPTIRSPKWRWSGTIMSNARHGVLAAAGIGHRQVNPASIIKQTSKGFSPGNDNTLSGRATWRCRSLRRRLPHDQDERKQAKAALAGAFVAHHADGRSEESVLQYPAGGAVARGAARVGGQRTTHGGRHARAVRKRPDVGIRPADGRGAVEQPAADDSPDRKFDRPLEADAQNVPFDSGGCGDRGGGRSGQPARRGAARGGQPYDRSFGQLRAALARTPGRAARPPASDRQRQPPADRVGVRNGDHHRQRHGTFLVRGYGRRRCVGAGGQQSLLVAASRFGRHPGFGAPLSRASRR